MTSSVYSRAVQRAAEFLGGAEKLASYLGVPAADVQQWLAGTRPPQAVFLRVVDFIIDETSPAQDGEPGEAPPGNDCAPAERSY